MTEAEQERARAIADAIIEELNSRKGLRHSWDMIDYETRDEIRDAWAAIVAHHLTERERDEMREALQFQCRVLLDGGNEADHAALRELGRLADTITALSAELERFPTEAQAETIEMCAKAATSGNMYRWCCSCGNDIATTIRALKPGASDA